MCFIMALAFSAHSANDTGPCAEMFALWDKWKEENYKRFQNQLNPSMSVPNPRVVGLFHPTQIFDEAKTIHYIGDFYPFLTDFEIPDTAFMYHGAYMEDAKDSLLMIAMDSVYQIRWSEYRPHICEGLITWPCQNKGAPAFEGWLTRDTVDTNIQTEFCVGYKYPRGDVGCLEEYIDSVAFWAKVQKHPFPLHRYKSQKLVLKITKPPPPPPPYPDTTIRRVEAACQKYLDSINRPKKVRDSINALPKTPKEGR
jgi:hypothetical protein